MRRISGTAALATVILLSSVVLAATDTAGNTEDTKAIDAIGAAYKAALKAGDAEAISKLWTDQGDFVNAMGQHVRGRRAIKKEFEAFFAQNSGGQELKTTRISLRFVTPSVAITDGIAEPVPPPPGPPIRERFTVVYVKQDGKWMVESVRETLASPASNYEHLAQLEWMIGDWAYRAGAANAVSTSVEWTMNRNFILRKISARLSDGTSVAGTQVIGWDPTEKQIRSWLFEANGAFVEGLWTRDGDRWVIKASGMLRDGRKVSATNVITPIDGGRFTFESAQRKADDQAEPDVGPITLERVPPQG